MPSQLPKTSIDLRGLMTYAKKQGKKVIELTESEKNVYKSVIYDTGSSIRKI